MPWRRNGEAFGAERKGSTHTHGEINRETEPSNPARPSEIGLPKESAEGRCPEGSKSLGKLDLEAGHKVRSDPGALAAALRCDAKIHHGGNRLAGAQRAGLYQRTLGQKVGPAGQIAPAGRTACVCSGWQ